MWIMIVMQQGQHLHCVIFICNLNSHDLKIWRLTHSFCPLSTLVGCQSISEVQHALTEKQQWLFYHKSSCWFALLLCVQAFILTFHSSSRLKGVCLAAVYIHNWLFVCRPCCFRFMGKLGKGIAKIKSLCLVIQSWQDSLLSYALGVAAGLTWDSVYFFMHCSFQLWRVFPWSDLSIWI